MRQPNHIILDFNTPLNSNSSQYWAINFLDKNNQSPNFISNLDVYKKYSTDNLYGKHHKVFLNEPKYTISTGSVSQINTLKVHKFNLTKLFSIKNSLNTDSYLLTTKHTSWHNLISINFLRKERLYTKLKYSRSPAYDSVSGGAAALLAGLIGFLISEKFGIELVDSGDFYYLFMYVVFLSFSLRPLLLVAESDKSFVYLFSLKRVINFYISILSTFLCWLKLLLS